MNRLILIGNGFDLAHGLKTSYNDFIDWVFDKEISLIKLNFKNHDSEISKVDVNPRKTDRYYSSVYYHDTFDAFINNVGEKHSEPLKGVKGFTILQKLLGQNDANLFITNKFLNHIITPNLDRNWYDIEESYYETLIEYIKDEEIKTKDSKSIKDKVTQLHKDFEQIKNLLEKYLTEQQSLFEARNGNNKLQHNIAKQMFSKIKFRELYSPIFKDKVDELHSKFQKIVNNAYKSAAENINEIIRHNLNEVNIFRELTVGMNIPYKIRERLHTDDYEEYDINPENILLLNFNYTKIGTYYNTNTYREFYKNVNVETIHIHGELNNEINPIIFGYGDELDDNYSVLEKLNDNEYLKNIKSIKYSDTDNYKRLLNYINSDQYQVYIFGHSVGLSDRTMLNTIFEHKNCVSIKPYYYKPVKGDDKYSDTVMNISRHFNDKAKMRDLVVNKTYCEAMPQINRNEE